MVLLSLCNYKGGNALKEVIIIHIKVNTAAAYAEFSQHIPIQGVAQYRDWGVSQILFCIRIIRCLFKIQIPGLYPQTF